MNLMIFTILLLAIAPLMVMRNDSGHEQSAASIYKARMQQVQHTRHVMTSHVTAVPTQALLRTDARQQAATRGSHVHTSEYHTTVDIPSAKIKNSLIQPWAAGVSPTSLPYNGTNATLVQGRSGDHNGKRLSNTHQTTLSHRLIPLIAFCTLAAAIGAWQLRAWRESATLQHTRKSYKIRRYRHQGRIRCTGWVRRQTRHENHAQWVHALRDTGQRLMTHTTRLLVAAMAAGKSITTHLHLLALMALVTLAHDKFFSSTNVSIGPLIKNKLLVFQQIRKSRKSELCRPSGLLCPAPPPEKQNQQSHCQLKNGPDQHLLY